jgi:hypothetical protein
MKVWPRKKKKKRLGKHRLITRPREIKPHRYTPVVNELNARRTETCRRNPANDGIIGPSNISHTFSSMLDWINPTSSVLGVVV